MTENENGAAAGISACVPDLRMEQARRGTREELHLQQPSEMRSAPAIRMPGLIMKKFIYMSLVVF